MQQQCTGYVFHRTLVLDDFHAALKEIVTLYRGVPVLKVSDPNPKKWVGG